MILFPRSCILSGSSRKICMAGIISLASRPLPAFHDHAMLHAEIVGWEYYIIQYHVINN